MRPKIFYTKCDKAVMIPEASGYLGDYLHPPLESAALRGPDPIRGSLGTH